MFNTFRDFLFELKTSLKLYLNTNYYSSVLAIQDVKYLRFNLDVF